MAQGSAKKNVSSARDWKAKVTTELELPSGEVCKVKRVGLEKLLAANVIPDSLTPMAEAAVQRGQGKAAKKTSDQDLTAMARDPQKMIEALDAFDRITEMVVLEPPVVWHKRPVEGIENVKYEEIPESERDEDVLYTDEVDAMDKMFIFNFVVGGTRDLEKFRTEFGQSLAGVQPVADVPDAS